MHDDDNSESSISIRSEFTRTNPKVLDAFNRAYTLTDYSIHNSLDKRHNFRKQTILNDERLTKDEKNEAIKILSQHHDYNKSISNV